MQDRTTGKVEVTAHNHGFAVDAPLDQVSETPYGRAEVSHVCLNDNVVEGLQLLDRRPSASSTTPKRQRARTTPPTCSTASYP